MPRSCDSFKITILKLSLLKPTSLLLVSVVVSTGLTLPIVASMSLYFHGVVKYDYVVTGTITAILVSFSIMSIMSILFHELKAKSLANQKSEAKLNEAQRLASLGSFEWNIPADDLEWSDEHFRLWGFEPGAFKPSLDLFLQNIPSEDREHVENTLKLALNNKKPYECFHRVCHPDGAVRFIHAKGAVTFDQGMRPVRMIGTVQDITRQKKAEADIHSLAFYDSLTNLPNRRLLLERLQQAMARSARNHHYGALLFLNIDHFKTLNDTRGHATGDILLREMAQRLQECMREGDTVARVSGDEFVIVIESLNHVLEIAAVQAELVAEKIQTKLNYPYDLNNIEYLATVSIGINMFKGRQVSVDELFKHSDIALYQAKTAGRNTIQFYDPAMQEALQARVALETDLRQALAQGQFELYYQTQVDDQYRIIGAEALLRWKHPVRGIVSPAQFIPLAEETGLIIPIGSWVLETACLQLKTWGCSELTKDLLLSINVSARQFRQVDFVEKVQSVLKQTGVAPTALKIELTESLVLDNINETISKMQALKSSGVKFSLDDFGTGQSSLMYLKRLPLDQLKIDQSFVRDITTDSSDAVIVQTIIGMANNLGLEAIAEGVETEAQREFLHTHGCHAYQGYLFSKPIPLAEFEGLLKQLRITIKSATANDPKPTTRYDAKSASDSNRKPATSSEAS